MTRKPVDINIKTEGTTVTVDINENINLNNVDNFGEKLSEITEMKDVSHVIINFKEVNYLQVPVLEEFLIFLKKLTTIALWN